MMAYDYTAQRWVSGPEGTRLRMAELQADLAMLEDGNDPEAYLRFIGSHLTVDEAKAMARACIAEAELELMSDANGS